MTFSSTGEVQAGQEHIVVPSVGMNNAIPVEVVSEEDGGQAGVIYVPMVSEQTQVITEDETEQATSYMELQPL